MYQALREHMYWLTRLLEHKRRENTSSTPRCSLSFPPYFTTSLATLIAHYITWRQLLLSCSWSKWEVSLKYIKWICTSKLLVHQYSLSSFPADSDSLCCHLRASSHKRTSTDCRASFSGQSQCGRGSRGTSPRLEPAINFGNHRLRQLLEILVWTDSGHKLNQPDFDL